MVNLLARKAVLASLSIRTWGATQQEQKVTEEIMHSKGALKDQGNFTKKLLNKKSMQSIKAARFQARKYHWDHTQPWMDNGTRILPTALYLEYAKEMQIFRDDFDVAVNRFASEYPSAIKAAKKELGSLFDPEDYPSIEEIKDKFSFDINFINVPDKQDFRVDLDKEVLDELKTKLDTHVNNQLKAAMKSTGERVLSVLEHMVLKLKEYKPKNTEKGRKAENTFRDSLVENVRELAELLPAFNIDENPTITKVHKRLLKELCLHDAETLREDKEIRKKVRQSAEEIIQQISEYLS